MDEAIKILKEVGFPIFMCVWFMTRTDKRLDRIITLIEKNHGMTE